MKKDVLNDLAKIESTKWLLAKNWISKIKQVKISVPFSMDSKANPSMLECTRANDERCFFDFLNSFEANKKIVFNFYYDRIFCYCSKIQMWKILNKTPSKLNEFMREI